MNCEEYVQGHGEVEEGDDEFEVYRKRMMLGYKHRPNPLGALLALQAQKLCMWTPHYGT